MGLKWLITGGCGFIGTSLIRKLVSEGNHAIRVIDNLSVGTLEDLREATDFSETKTSEISTISPVTEKTHCELIVDDILDEKLALKGCDGADVIVHLAANTGVAPSVENPRADCQTNVIGTLNYLEGARHNKVKRFVFASSGAPVGEVEPPIHEELPAHPVSPYGASKLAGEGYCSSYYRTFGVETVALRFGNVYGPGSKHKSSVVAKFIKQAMEGLPLEIYGDGNQTRDFLYIDDLTDAIVLASSAKNIGGEIFQIATNQETTVSDITQLLVSKLEENGIKKTEIIHGKNRIGDVKRNYSDTAKARIKLGWNAHVKRENGVERTIEWFINREQ